MARGTLHRSCVVLSAGRRGHSRTPTGAVRRAGDSYSHWTDFMLFWLLVRGAFQLSLTVLVRYRSPAFVFSLGWPAPPVFSQHSQAGLLAGPPPVLTGPSPPTGFNGHCLRDSTGLRGPEPEIREDNPLDHRSPSPRGAGGFSLGLIPVRSQLLGESLLISFPPLTYMLKLGG